MTCLHLVAPFLLAVGAQAPAAVDAPLEVPVEAPVTAPMPEAAPPAKAARFEIVRVAVYDLESTSVAPDIVKVVTEALLDELRKRRGLSVVGMREIRAMLDHEAQRQVMGCDDEQTSCLAEIADALGVDAIVIGSLARVGDEHVVAMRRIDQGEAKVGATWSKRVAAENGVELLATIGPMVPALFPGRALLPGQRAGVDPEVALRLNPPPLSPWIFAGGATATGALAVGAAIAGAVGATLYFGPYEELLQKGASATGASARELLDTQQQVNTSGTAAWALAGGALVVGIATAALIPLTDFKGYRAAAQEGL